MALVAWYKLNGNVLDSTVNGNHGTIVGSPTVVSDGPFGSCYLFNPDTNDRITINNLSSFIYNTPFTFSAWIKTSGLGTGQTVNGIVSLTYGTGFYGNSAGNIYIRFLSTSIGSYSITSSGININDNIWHHVCCTYNGDQVKLYIDGVLNNSSVTGIVQTNTYTNNGAIGLDVNDPSKYKFNGSISDVRIYDEALSLKEIKELSKAKVLHYDFNQYQEPTTNLALNDITVYTPYHLMTRDGQNLSFTMSSTPYAIVIDIVALGSLQNRTFAYSGIMKKNGVPYIYSSLLVNTYNASSSSKLKYFDSITGYFEIVEFFDSTSTWVMHSNLNSTAVSGDVITIENFQIEEKDHVTPFVNGTRTAQVYDKSGYDNNAFMSATTSPRWISGGPTNGGYYSFKSGQTLSKTGSLPLQDHTMSFWFNLHTPFDGNWYNIFMNSNVRNPGIWVGNSWNGVHWNLNSTTNYSINPTLDLNKWYFICVSYNTIDQKMKMYIGDDAGSFSLYGTNTIPSPLSTGTGNMYFTSSNPNYDISDFRIYSTALSEDDIKEIYQTKASIDKNGNLYCNNIEENKYVAPLVDYTSWVVGTSGAQTGFALNGATTENYIIEGSDPFNNIIPIWEARPDAISDADGGWATSSFNIDNTKLYRFSVWVRRTVIGNGSFYLGVNGYGSVNGVYSLDDVNNTNPYFYSSSGLFTNRQDQWLLVVGYVYPYTYTGTTSPADAGIYNVDGTKIVASTTSFKWRPETTTARHRSYLYYSTNIDTRQQWCYPRVDVCDGTEPTITDLLNGIDYKHYQITKDLIASKGINKNSSILSNEFSEVGITEGLVAYYPLNGDAKDYSGNNNHGTVYGAIKASGINNKKCYYFDAVDDYIQLPSDLGYTTAFTACAWFKSLGTPTGGYHIIFGGSQLEISVPTAGSLRIGLNTSIRYVNDYGSGLTDGNWHHVCMTFDGTKKRGYINGSLVGEADVEGTLVYSFNRTIGRYGTSTVYYTNGLIQDVRIYNRALSDKEIGILYNTFNPNINKTLQINKENIIYTKGNIKEV